MFFIDGPRRPHPHPHGPRHSTSPPPAPAFAGSHPPTPREAGRSGTHRVRHADMDIGLRGPGPLRPKRVLGQRRHRDQSRELGAQYPFSRCPLLPGARYRTWTAGGPSLSLRNLPNISSLCTSCVGAPFYILKCCQYLTFWDKYAIIYASFTGIIPL